MRLRYSGQCVICGNKLPKGTEALWDPTSKKTTCTPCSRSASGALPIEPGVAGASARREGERRKAKREGRVRSKLPKAVGGIYLKIFGDPQSTKAWQKGAVGEERVGNRLDALTSEGILTLHDRRIPGSRANVDHVTVAPSGIHVIDTKRYAGKVHIRNKGGLLRPDHRLYVGSRDRSRLVDAMAKQVIAVDATVRDMPEILTTPLTPVLCFVGADWEFFSPGRELDGVRIMWPKALQKLLRRPGPLSRDQIETITRRLAQRLSPA